MVGWGRAAGWAGWGRLALVRDGAGVGCLTGARALEHAADIWLAQAGCAGPACNTQQMVLMLLLLLMQMVLLLVLVLVLLLQMPLQMLLLHMQILQMGPVLPRTAVLQPAVLRTQDTQQIVLLVLLLIQLVICCC